MIGILSKEIIDQTQFREYSREYSFKFCLHNLFYTSDTILLAIAFMLLDRVTNLPGRAFVLPGCVTILLAIAFMLLVCVDNQNGRAFMKNGCAEC